MASVNRNRSQRTKLQRDARRTGGESFTSRTLKQEKVKEKSGNETARFLALERRSGSFFQIRSKSREAHRNLPSQRSRESPLLLRGCNSCSRKNSTRL